MRGDEMVVEGGRRTSPKPNKSNVKKPATKNLKIKKPAKTGIEN